MTARARALTGADQIVASSRSLYRGFSVRETAAAPAQIRIYDNGTAASGTLLDTINLAASASLSHFYDPAIVADNGIYVDIVAGTVEGSIRVG